MLLLQVENVAECCLKYRMSCVISDEPIWDGDERGPALCSETSNSLSTNEMIILIIIFEHWRTILMSD